MPKVNYAEIFESLVDGFGYKLVSPYVKASEKVKIKCDQGHEYEVIPTSFKAGCRCPVCSGMCPVQAKKAFESLVIEWNYKLLSPYVHSQGKVQIKCDQGHEYEVIPNTFKRGCRCLVCSGMCPVQAKKAFESLVIEWNYKLLSPYVHSQGKVQIKCDQGHEYTVSPNKFKTGCRCPSCTKKGFNPDKPAILYLTDLHSDNGLVALKFGITNREVETRIKEHSKDSEYDHSIVHTVSHTNGQLILDLENHIKEKVETHYLTKEQLPDGYTEATSTSNRKLILDLMNEFEEQHTTEG